MGHEPSAESKKIRDGVLAALKDNPQGLPPGEIAKLVFEVEEVENNERQRVQYWVTSLTNSKHIHKKGYGRAALYALNKGRPEPDVHDVPARRTYTKRAKPDAATNGVAGSASGVIAYVIRDIRAKLNELEGLIH